MTTTNDEGQDGGDGRILTAVCRMIAPPAGLGLSIDENLDSLFHGCLHVLFLFFVNQAFSNVGKKDECGKRKGTRGRGPFQAPKCYLLTA